MDAEEVVPDYAILHVLEGVLDVVHVLETVIVLVLINVVIHVQQDVLAALAAAENAMDVLRHAAVAVIAYVVLVVVFALVDAILVLELVK